VVKTFDKRLQKGVDFSQGTMLCDTDQSRALQSATAVVLSCRYWRLSDTFCCMHCSRDFHCFSVGRTTPKIAASCGSSQTPSNTWFFGPRWVSPPNQHPGHLGHFCTAYSCAHCPTHAACDICSSRPHVRNSCYV